MKNIFLILLLLPSLACYISNNATQTPITPTDAIKTAPVVYIPLPTNTEEPTCTITAQKLNLRLNPDSSVIAWLYQGDLVTVLGETRGKWIQVRAADNVTGWIRSNYCKGK